MSEEIVPYRTKNAAREPEALTRQILNLIAEARHQGIEPTEACLGRREFEVFDAAEASSNTCCYASGQRQICGLTVRRSADEGIWVGTTVGQTNSGKTRGD